ncbi:unnamed protein product [Ilex paraguariensis]|uniref:Receptor-like protein 12 n=1 Tax=Ilex paraguariensis TaxID=185542 RepID=A0ABC8SD66_9AQUA
MGPTPQSLINCGALKILDLGNNKISGTFPYWLENLPLLQVLILRSNRFHGPIATSMTQFPLISMRVFDISYNDFNGPLPAKYFKSFKAMMNIDEGESKLEYMRSEYIHRYYCYDSYIVTIKGSTIEMGRALTILTIIDLSRNNFEGEIPEFIGNLNSLRGLNLSHNKLTGHIPASLGDMRMLEGLDLSSNKLVGEIPRHLTALLSLAVLHLSNNQLTGPIPQGNQFNTFPEDSYAGNSGLCGFPLLNKCSNYEAPPPPPLIFQEDDSLEFRFDWKVMFMGYGCGFIFGISMGYIMFSIGKPKWIVRVVENQGHKNKTTRRCAHSHKSGGK